MPGPPLLREGIAAQNYARAIDLVTMGSIRAAKLIVADLKDRSGLGNAWDDIDPDIQAEIVQEWGRLIDASKRGAV